MDAPAMYARLRGAVHGYEDAEAGRYPDHSHTSYRFPKHASEPEKRAYNFAYSQAKAGFLHIGEAYREIANKYPVALVGIGEGQEASYAVSGETYRAAWFRDGSGMVWDLSGRIIAEANVISYAWLSDWCRHARERHAA